MYRRTKTGRSWVSLAAAGALVLVAATPSESPVADAAQRGDLEEVRTLVRSGADVNAAQADGMTALHWAATNGFAEIAQVLLYGGAAVEPATRVGGYTPLHLAGRSGHSDIVATLLENGAEVDRYTSTGVTAMHFAAEADAPDAIRELAGHGGDVDAPDSFSSRTPLMFAAARNATRALQALLVAGADPSLTTDVKDYVEFSREMNEDRRRRERIKDAMEEPEEEEEEERAGRGRGGPPAQAQQARARAGRSGQTPPDTTAAEPDTTAADPDEPEEEEEPEPEPEGDPRFKSNSSTEQIGDQGGFTALHFATREGHIEASRILLEGGADVDQVTDGDQSSPLLVAIINGHYDLATELLERGADPNLLSDDGAGPLFATLNIEWALRTWYPQPGAFRRQATSYLDLMEMLLEAGADPNQRVYSHIWYAAYNAGRMGVDFTGASPFWRAAYAADVRAMKLLVEYGADPNIGTYNFARSRRGGDDDDEDDEEPELDPSGLPPMEEGGTAVHPIHAASGVGFGTSRVAQQHRSAPGGWLASMKYLVGELGMDPNMRDKDGYTPVHHSAARGDNETILYLVAQGADVTLVSRRGQTTADMANSPEQRAQPHPATIALLEKLGSKNNHNCRSCGGE